MEKSAANDDLNERVQRWRETLIDRPGIGETDVDELESHLRDTVDRLTAAALTQEEAFLAAAHRIGSPVELEDQYSAVYVGEAWKARVIWMVVGVLGYWTLTGISAALSELTLVVGSGQGFGGVSLARWGTLIYLVAMVGVGCLVFKYLRRRVIRPKHPGPIRNGNGSMWLIVCLAITSLSATLANLSVNIVAAKLQGPATLGSYFLFTGYFMRPVSYLLVVICGIWFARRKSCQIRRAGTVVGLLLLFASVGCSPDTNSTEESVISTNAPTTADQASGPASPGSTNPNSAPALTGSKTPFEQCMALVPGNPNGAVDAFMKLDVTSGTLFTFGSPLSYSETQFANLPNAVRTKIAETMMQDTTAIKRLIEAVNTRREEARATKDEKTADQYSKQLAALGTRLQGSENLKLTQLVGAAASMIAAR